MLNKTPRNATKAVNNGYGLSVEQDSELWNSLVDLESLSEDSSTGCRTNPNINVLQ